METHLERRFPADIEQLAQVLSFVLAQARQGGLTPDRLGNLELALEEAVVNVCRHAYGVGGGDLLVRVGDHDGRFAVELVDRAEAFDPLAAPAPDLAAPLAERPIGGLGVFLIRRLMDDVQYRREGDRNVLRLVVARG